MGTEFSVDRAVSLMVAEGYALIGGNCEKLYVARDQIVMVIRHP